MKIIILCLFMLPMFNYAKDTTQVIPTNDVKVIIVKLPPDTITITYKTVHDTISAPAGKSMSTMEIIFLILLLSSAAFGFWVLVTKSIDWLIDKLEK